MASKCFREELEAEVRSKFMSILKSGKYDIGFCLGDGSSNHPEPCAECKELLDRLVAITMSAAGFKGYNDGTESS